jgi:hypothetical protein
MHSIIACAGEAYIASIVDAEGQNSSPDEVPVLVRSSRGQVPDVDRRFVVGHGRVCDHEGLKGVHGPLACARLTKEVPTLAGSKAM